MWSVARATPWRSKRRNSPEVASKGCRWKPTSRRRRSRARRTPQHTSVQDVPELARRVHAEKWTAADAAERVKKDCRSWIYR